MLNVNAVVSKCQYPALMRMLHDDRLISRRKHVAAGQSQGICQLASIPLRPQNQSTLAVVHCVQAQLRV